MHYVSPEHQVVTFDGVDALAFLQSQLTNDVAALAVGGWQWQGYCNAKGRLHATFALARTGEATYAAVVHRSVVPFLVKRLTMFRLRSKVAIAADDRFTVLHHIGEPTTPAPDVAGARLALGNDRWVDITTNNKDELPADTPEPIGRWKQLGIEAKQPEIVAETNEMFVPQMIGFDKLSPASGVSFSKGCYPGQEVVARAHYRGAVKRALAIVSVPRNGSLAPGSLYTRADASVAEIVNAVEVGDEIIALAVVPLKASENTDSAG
jgi:tRNA-modifying protein YgfZ